MLSGPHTRFKTQIPNISVVYLPIVIANTVINIKVTE